MPDIEPQSSLILYQTEDGRTRIQCRFDVETIWLTQVQIAELFQTSVPNINLHLTAIYAEGELTGAATIKSSLIVRNSSKRRRPAGIPRGVTLQPSRQQEGQSSWEAAIRKFRIARLEARRPLESELIETATIRNLRTVRREGDWE